MQSETRPTPFFSPYSSRPSFQNQAAFFSTGALAGLSTLPIEFLLSSLASTTSPTGSSRVSSRPPPTAAFLSSHLPQGLYRPAIRFWGFSLARARFLHESEQAGVEVPTWLIGGAAGAVGGFMEVFVEYFVNNLRSGGFKGQKGILSSASSGGAKDAGVMGAIPKAALAEQSAKLFLCFGSYTYLASAWAEREEKTRERRIQKTGKLEEHVRLPPTPFWKCWGYGAAAGGFGLGTIWLVKEGVDGGKWYKDGKRGGAIAGARWWKGLGGAAGKGALIVGTVISVQVTSCRMVLDVLDE